MTAIEIIGNIIIFIYILLQSILTGFIAYSILSVSGMD